MPDLYSLIIGTVIGGILSSMGYLYQKRAERKKKLNQVLYTMLEVWHIVFVAMKFRNGYVWEQLQGYLAHNGIHIPETDEYIDEFIRKQSIALLDDLIERRKNVTGKDFHEKYNEALHDISSTYPILAYEISRNQSVEKILEFLDSYFDKAKHFAANEEEQKFASILKNKLKNKMSEESIDKLEKDLFKVAWKSGFWNWMKTKSKVKNKKNQRIYDEGNFNEIINLISDPKKALDNA